MFRLKDYIGPYWAGAEVIYAIIIAMTFTSVLWDFENVPRVIIENVTTTAFLCCLAWGFADGFFYIWERNYLLNRERLAIKLAKDPQQRDKATALVQEQLEDTFFRYVPEKKRQALYQIVADELVDEKDVTPLGAKGVATIWTGTIFLSTMAGALVILPFYLFDELGQAILASNLLGISILFIVGFLRMKGRKPWVRLVGAIGTAWVGMVISLITTLLGG